MRITNKFISEEEYLAQMKTGALLNPRIDSTFKALFTQPTEESRNALHSFLEAATERKIKTVELTANEAPAAFENQRGVSYDILCIFDDGKPANLEMMAFNQQYPYGKRAEYQVARLENSIEKNTALENWAIFLKDADNPKKTGIIQKLTETEAGLMNAKQSLSSISADRDLWVEQFRQEIHERDYRSGIAAAEDRGHKQGLAEGMSKGLAKGALERNIALAKKYMTMGHTAEEAATFAEIDVKLLNEKN